MAPGVAGTDAVNVNQLNAGVAGANAYTDARVNGLQNAGKLTYAAGLGHYKAQSAVGISFRRTADNGRWSVTAGLSAGSAAMRVGVSGVWD